MSFAAVYFLDESPDHHFCGIEVRYDASPERADSLDAGVFLFLHPLGFLSQGYQFPGAVLYGDDARFVKNYLVILENDGVGCPQVYRKLLRKQ